MNLLDFFRVQAPSSASVAKERLKILVSHEHNLQNQPSYLAELQKELLLVVRKYVEVDDNAINIKFAQNDSQEMFELDIRLPGNNTD